MGIEKQISVVCLVVLMVGAVACGRTPMQKRDQFLGSGRRLFERKEYARAVLDFKNAAAAMPRDAEAYYQLGRAYAAYGELQSAVYSFRKAIDRNPKHAGAQLELSKIMAATIDSDILQDAENRLTVLLQEGTAGPEALNTLAFTQLKLGKSDLAMRNLQMALAMAPQSLNSSILMAQAKLGQRDWKGAEEALQTACANAPGSPEARVVLGNFYVTRSRFSEAEQQFQQALSLDPKHPSALLEIGKLELQAGKTQEADETFKRLSALPNPTTKPAHALFLLQEGRKEEAIREFEGLAKSNPEDREARTRLIAAYQSAGKSLDAERVLTAALKNNQKDLDALLQRGEMYLAEGKFQLAETDLNQVLREKPSSAEVHYVLAKLHAARETVLLERQELSEALRLNPMRLQVRLELVQLLLRNNGAKSAIEILNETPAFQQQTLAFLTQRNWVLWALGDLKELEKGVDQGLAAVRTPDLLIQNGLLKLRHGDFKAARTSLEEAMRIDPQDLRALDVIRRSYMAQKQMPIAVQKVKEYAAGSPRSAPVQEFLGSVLMGSGDRKGARAAFEAAKEADKTSKKPRCR